MEMGGKMSKKAFFSCEIFLIFFSSQIFNCWILMEGDGPYVGEQKIGSGTK